MKKTAVVLLVGALVAWTGVAQGEPIWWANEWDCSVAPEAATPAWSATTGSSDGDIWTQTTDSKWTGPQTEWAGPTSTVEIRFKFNGAGDGVIFQSLPAQYQGVLKPGDDASDVLSLSGRNPGGDHSMDENWNILRILYDETDGSDVYLLPGGALSGNGGNWTQDQIDNPLTTSWLGYGSNTDYLLIGGAMEIDYVRWKIEDLIPPALPGGGPSCNPGDADDDGDVDDDDLSLLLSNWGGNVDCTKGEFSGTPPVDDDDLSLLLSNWTGSPAAVPEPATVGILLLGAVALRRRRG